MTVRSWEIARPWQGTYVRLGQGPVVDAEIAPTEEAIVEEGLGSRVDAEIAPTEEAIAEESLGNRVSPLAEESWPVDNVWAAEV